MKAGKIFVIAVVYGFLALVLHGCNGGEVGSNEPSDRACSSDADCQSGYHCDQLLNICVPDAQPDGDELDQEQDLPDFADPDPQDKLEPDSISDVEPEPEEEAGPIDTDGKIIKVNPLVADFGFVLYGESKTVEITIQNASEATESLEVSQITFKHEGEDIDFTFQIADGSSLPRLLQPSEFFVVEVTYTPSDAVPDTDEELLISSDDRDNPLVRVKLEPKYKGEAHLLVEPEAIEFGDVPVGGTAVESITITNGCDADGNQVLRIDSIALLSSGGLVGNDFTVEPDQTPTPENPIYLNPQQTLTITVTYAPTEEGGRTDTLYILSNDPEYPAPGFGVQLSGNGVAADLQVVPNPIQFDTVRVGTQAEQTVRIINTGEDTLNISSISLRETGTDFSLETGGQTSWSLAFQEEVQITVIFAPQTTGEQYNKLVIISDGDVTNYQVPILGKGAVSRIRVEPSELDFGNVQVSATGRATVEVISEGELPLNITGIEVSDPTGCFGYTENPDYYTPINPGFSRLVEFTFTPAGTGASWQAIAKIFSDAENTDTDGSVSVLLRASSSDPRIFVNPTHIEFDPVEIGDTDTKQITVTNIGDGALTIFDIQLSGGSATVFSISNLPPQFPVDLTRNQSITFEVNYSPTGPGEATGSVLIVHNDYDEFGEGDLDRTEFEVTLHASGPLNHQPVAVLNVNGRTDCPIYVDFNALLTLTDDGSYDPDEGDQIVAWDYRIETAPSGHNELTCSENTCTVYANVQGEWLFSLRVQDTRGAWSEKDTCRVEVGEPPNQRPIANIRANGSETDLTVTVGEQVVFDDLGSSDPDGYITDWNYYISSAPPGYNQLTGSGNTRSLIVNVEGSWVVCLKVKDDDGEWSDPDCIGIEATPPPDQAMKLVLDGINWSACFHLSMTPPANVGSEPCDEDHAPQCTWGPSHSGAPQGLPGNNGSSVEIVWSSNNIDGEYMVRVLRQGSVGGISCSILGSETTRLRFYRDGVEFYRCELEWGFFGSNTWDLTWERSGGVWLEPVDHSNQASCQSISQ